MYGLEKYGQNKMAIDLNAERATNAPSQLYGQGGTGRNVSSWISKGQEESSLRYVGKENDALVDRHMVNIGCLTQEDRETDSNKPLEHLLRRDRVQR
jgi:hypothetical protein